jgi:hypothetical protein
MGDECGFNYHFVLASMPKPIFPHQVHHIWEMWFCQVLDLDRLRQWSSPHALNYWKNNLIIRVPNLWKPMEDLHKLANRNNLNWQNP